MSESHDRSDYEEKDQENAHVQHLPVQRKGARFQPRDQETRGRDKREDLASIAREILIQQGGRKIDQK